jgi:GxxExxY protein
MCEDMISRTQNKPIGSLPGFFETYRELGQGFSEQVLCRALAIVLRAAGLSVLEEAELDVWFRGQCIGRFRADLIVNRTILIEVKGMSETKSFAEAQLLNYLKAAGAKRSVLSV